MCVYIYIYIYIYISLNNDEIRPHCVVCGVCSVTDRRKSLDNSPRLKKTCVGQVVSEEWFTLKQCRISRPPSPLNPEQVYNYCSEAKQDDKMKQWNAY